MIKNISILVSLIVLAISISIGYKDVKSYVTLRKIKTEHRSILNEHSNLQHKLNLLLKISKNNQYVYRRVKTYALTYFSVSNYLINDGYKIINNINVTNNTNNKISHVAIVGKNYTTTIDHYLQKSKEFYLINYISIYSKVTNCSLTDALDYISLVQYNFPAKIKYFSISNNKLKIKFNIYGKD